MRKPRNQEKFMHSWFLYENWCLSECRKVVENKTEPKSGIHAGLAVDLADFILNYIPPNT